MEMDMGKIPKALNVAEETFSLQCRCRKLCPEREYEFCPGRKWRFDFAWPIERIAVEIEGGVHRIKDRFHRDIEKYNTAALMGWRVLRYTPKMIDEAKALEDIESLVVV